MSPEQLDSSLHLFSGLLLACAGLVFIGVFMEEYDHVIHFLAWLRRMGKPARPDIRWETIGALILIMGVAGDFVVESRITVIDETFRFMSEADLKQANNRLAIAEASLTPRSLSLEEQTVMVSDLKPFSGTPFELSVDPDPESLRFLGTIDSILTSSGWTATTPQLTPGEDFFTLSDGHEATIEYITGIDIEIPRSRIAGWGQACATFGGALIARHVNARVEVGEDGQNRAIHVIVGSKR